MQTINEIRVALNNNNMRVPSMTFSGHRRFH